MVKNWYPVPGRTKKKKRHRKPVPLLSSDNDGNSQPKIPCRRICTENRLRMGRNTVQDALAVIVFLRLNSSFSLSSLANVRKESHETGTLDSCRDGILARGGAAALAAAQDLALAIRQFFQQFNVFVVNIKRTGQFAVDRDRILFLRTDLRLRAFTERSSTLLAFFVESTSS